MVLRLRDWAKKNFDFVQAADALACCAPSYILTDFNCDQWNLHQLSLQLSSHLGASAKRIFSVFCDGRPLFGTTIAKTGGYYGYLSRNGAGLTEAIEPLAELEDNPYTTAKLQMIDGELIRLLTEKIRRMDKRGLDLWISVRL